MRLTCDINLQLECIERSLLECRIEADIEPSELSYLDNNTGKGETSDTLC